MTTGVNHRQAGAWVDGASRDHQAVAMVELPDRFEIEALAP